MTDTQACRRGRRFPWNLDHTSVCDQCGKWRAHGNHLRCSRRRQRQNAHLRQQPPTP